MQNTTGSALKRFFQPGGCNVHFFFRSLHDDQEEEAEVRRAAALVRADGCDPHQWHILLQTEAC